MAWSEWVPGSPLTAAQERAIIVSIPPIDSMINRKYSVKEAGIGEVRRSSREASNAACSVQESTQILPI
jgi:hypothetical protein